MRRAGLAEMMGQRAAAAGAFGHDDLDTEARQQPHRRLVDARVEHGLRTAVQQRDTHLARTLRGDDLRLVDRRGCRNGGRRHADEALQPAGQQAGEGPGEAGALQGEAEERRARQHECEQRAQQTVRQRPHIGLLDMRAGMIDEVHVVHARGAGRHAGEAGETTVDVLHGARIRRPVLLQHVLHQVDAAAR